MSSGQYGRPAARGRRVMTVRIDGLILACGRLAPGRLRIEGPRLGPPEGPAADHLILPEGWIVAPGMVDLQVNGFAGVEVDDNPRHVEQIAAALPRHGVTAFCPTVISRPWADYPGVARGLARARRQPGAATILGCHLEGPFVAARWAGAHQPRHLRPPHGDTVGALLEWFSPAILTMAPEQPGAMAAIERAVAAGVVVGMGHTGAGADVAVEAIDRGARLLTHAFNAMEGIAHRRPSALVAALADERVAIGLIGDGIHVDPSVALLAARIAGTRLTLVSDASALAGCQRPRATLSGRTVWRRGDRSTGTDGSLAGAAVGLDRGPATLVAAGVAVADALDAACAAPRRLLGIEANPCPGAAADLVILDPALRPRATVIAGRTAYLGADLAVLGERRHRPHRP